MPPPRMGLVSWSLRTIDAWDESLPSPDAKPASPETTPATPERPPRVISHSKFEKVLKEITPSSSESLGNGTTSLERGNMCGKGSFGFIEKGKGQGEIKIATSAGPTSMPSGGVDLRLLEL
ncbi:hypothetical protein BJ322DRAFT_1023755 [Thelephora terrestris]|uniref:Uncharacterized protein n=1 Tax=Thelephora terrestris TaxID=56493 RepID=A0A9P6L3C3_9AGAM|nr:hypothetical protein BJ322DRAFT_1023755 [Thelephora terrestris]